MNFLIRTRVRTVACVVLAAGLVGCQTCRDCVDRIPGPSLPKLGSIIPFGKSSTPVYAEPYRPPKLEPVPDSPVPDSPAPDSPAPLILPSPEASTPPSRIDSRQRSTPPALPPFEPETKVPSAGLFPSGPVRKMGFEASGIEADSAIIQTGGYAPMVTGCCPEPCCPPPCCPVTCCPVTCCEVPCCSSGGLSSVLGRIAHPFYAAKYRIQNAKDRLKCRLSSIGSYCRACSIPCCSPCVSSCVPCSGGCELEGVVVGQYPLVSGCTTCSSGVPPVPRIPMHYQPAPQQQSWRQAPHHYVAPSQPQYQGAHPAYAAPQAAVRQPVSPHQYQPASPQLQRRNPSPQPQVARSPQEYTAPRPVEPLSPQSTKPATRPSNEATKSSLAPGHAPLADQSGPSRVARIFRATRFE